MDLLEKLAEKAQEAEFEKTAEEIFVSAFLDELEKIGFDKEAAKKISAKGLKGLWAAIKARAGVLKGRAPKVTGAPAAKETALDRLYKKVKRQAGEALARRDVETAKALAEGRKTGAYPSRFFRGPAEGARVAR